MRRGDVFELKLPKGVGHEHPGRRFGVVVRSGALLSRSVVLVAPTSASARPALGQRSASARPAAFRPEIDVDAEATRVLVEQVGAVDVRRLGSLAGGLTPAEQWGVDESLPTVLGLR